MTGVQTCALPISLSVAGEQALQLLAPYLLEVQEVSEWPGTKLYRHTATLYKYNVCPAFSELLKNLAQGLYEWEHPDLPEDLGFMLTEKLPWLFTIAHERDAVLCLTAAEVDDLMADDALASILTRDKNYDEG